jgi:hypothetical protein
MEDISPLFYYMTLTEISNVFLVSQQWIQRSSYLYYANKVAFYITFAKFRVHDIYHGLIHRNSSMYLLVDKYTPNSIPGIGLIMSIYILYGLNLYWFAYINRKAYELLSNQQSKDKIAED